MANEIINIIKKGDIKKISDQVWNNNNYQNRWNFIIDKICDNLKII